MTLFPVFIASLLGSAHCVGMCGGIVLLCCTAEGQKLKRSASYNFGRLSSYLLLGGVAGALGHSLNLAGAASGIAEAASLVFGAFLVAWGLYMLVVQRSPLVAGPGSASSAKTGPVQKMFNSLFSEQSGSGTLRAYCIGLLSTLLPCGWLYSFAAVAAGTGNILEGALVMAVFWLGTVPYLAGVAAASQTLLGPLRKKLPTITALLIVAAGLISVSMHFKASGTERVLEEKPKVEAGVREQVVLPDSSEHSCH